MKKIGLLAYSLTHSKWEDREESEVVKTGRGGNRTNILLCLCMFGQICYILKEITELETEGECE